MTCPEESAPRADQAKLEAHLADQLGNLNVFADFFWHRVRTDFVLRSLRRCGIEGGTVVDIGAGAGVFGFHLEQLGSALSYTFAEPIDALARELCQRHGNDSNWSARPRWPAEAAVILDVIEHIEDDTAFLRDVIERLPKGCVVVMTSPALPSLWSDWDERFGHYRRYRASTLRRCTLEAGFEVVSSRYLFQSMILPGWLRKLRRGGEGVEFPRLPPLVNRLALAVGRFEVEFCGWMPFGSSVGVVARVP